MSRSKTALITGVTGQDGAYLAAQLLAEGWKVYGGHRRCSSGTVWRLEYLGITSQVSLTECQITEAQNLIQVVQEIQPSHIFHLAGESFVADSFKYPGLTTDVNIHGAINVLEAVRLVSPATRVFCASSSEIFGTSDDGTSTVNETSEFKPVNPYAISKLAAFNFVRLYRKRYGMYACSGILFNHESPLRSRSFVTRKITFNLARLKVQGGPAIELGNLNSARDWGSASDYVTAMRLMSAIERPTDLIIATGRVATVRDFFRKAAIAAGFAPVFEGEGIDEVCVDHNSNLLLARVSEKYFRPLDTPPLVGDVTQIKKLTGWNSSQTMENLINEMVAADVDRWKSGFTEF